MKQPIDIFSTLVMSVFNNKGVYALLLGSGISLPAKIMSGWKVTEDLIKKLATVQGETITTDAFQWFKEKYGCDAEYSKLLEQLGHKPSEMESLLRPYFEPSEEDIEFGYKKPTVAHKAIAEMAKRGYFKLIITTNFDRLLESALDELGVRYQVICHESEIESRVPLYHHPLTLLKINGDYKDCRFRNTEAELNNYPRELVDYLDAILKNFGIITCGWSGTWDKALMKQLAANENHRYSYIYTFLGEESSEMKTLSAKSNGEKLQIEDADSFFLELNERLKALEMINGKNMETDAEVAVARVKMYIADQKKIIQYSDLFENVTNQLLRDVKGLVYASQYPNAALFEQTIAENVNALSIIIPMSQVAIRWAGKDHYAAIADSLSMVANREIEKPTSSYYENTLKLNRVLDTTYLYGLGIACVYYGKFGLLDKLFRVKFFEYDHYFSPYIIDQDHCWVVSDRDWNNSTGYSRRYTQFSATLTGQLRKFFSMIRDENEYYSFVCIFEKLLAMYFQMLICKESTLSLWPPIGMFCWRPNLLERRGKSTYKDFFDQINQNKENAQVIKDGMFEGSYEKYKEAYDEVTALEPKAFSNLYYG